MAAATLITNERYLNGIGWGICTLLVLMTVTTWITRIVVLLKKRSHCIHNEKFEFNFDSEDEEDEVFFGEDIGFKEKCQSAVVNELCDFKPIAELTDEQWVHMKEQTDHLIFLLWEEKKNSPNSPAVAVPVPSSRNIIQSPQITSSPAMSTRSKRKMQLISNSPYKISPLKDITNRSVIKPSPGIITPQSIKKLASSKLDISNDQILYEQLGLVNPVRLNFDDVEHSPKKNRCLDPCFTGPDSPLITDEACWDVLMSSPDVKQTKAVRESLGLNQIKAVRESLGLNPRMSLDAKMKSRIRSKTVTLNESSILLPSRPTIPSSNTTKENKISSKNKEKSCEPKLKSPRKSLLNVSFTIDKKSETLLGIVSTPTESSDNEEKDKPTLNESFTINKSQGRESVLNESFTINKSYVRDSTGGRPSLNESFTIKKSIARDSLIGKHHLKSSSNYSSIRSSMTGKATLNESFTVDDQSTRSSMTGKATLNESFTVDDSTTRSSMNGKPALNESFTVNDQSTRSSMTGKATLNESFTVNDSTTLNSMKGKPALNESFTVNDQSTRSSMNGKPALNESFTVNDQSTRNSMTGKATLNESFTVDDSTTRNSMNGKATLNESFTVDDSTTRNSMNGKATLNESFTVDDSTTRNSMNGKATLNESFTVDDSTTRNSMNGKATLNESFTVDDSTTRNSMIGKATLNESFTTENSYVVESVDEQPALNESFTIDDSQSVDTSIVKPALNGSFTVNKSQLEGVINEKSMNESLMMETDSQITEASTKKPVLNESFTLEKSTLNASFPADSSIDNSHLDTSSIKVARTTLKKKSPSGRLNSSNASLINKSTTDDKSSRKRTLGTPTRQGNEPPSKTTVFSRSEINKRQVPTIKSSNGPKPTISRLQPSKTNFSLTRPDMAFGSTSTLPKDKHGIVKFEEKYKVPEKKPKSNLLLPSKLTRKSLKVSPKKPLPKKQEEPKVQSPVMRPKRKCIQSTPPISRIGSIKPVESSLNGNASALKTRLVLPSKLPSNIGKPMLQSRIPNKGPLRALPTLGKVPEVKPSEGSHLPFAGKSKLRMPSPVKSRIPYMNFKPT